MLAADDELILRSSHVHRNRNLLYSTLAKNPAGTPHHPPAASSNRPHSASTKASRRVRRRRAVASPRRHGGGGGTPTSSAHPSSEIAMVCGERGEGWGCEVGEGERKRGLGMIRFGAFKRAREGRGAARVRAQRSSARLRVRHSAEWSGVAAALPCAQF